MAVNRNKNKYKPEIVLNTYNHLKLLDSVLLKKKMYRKLLNADLVVQINKNPPAALCYCIPTTCRTVLYMQPGHRVKMMPRTHCRCEVIQRR